LVETDAKKLKHNELILPIDQQWDLSPHIFENLDNFHVNRDDSDFISDFIYRRKEGALLISGNRGVGKTSIIISTINRLRNQLKTENESEKIELLPVLINAANFEIWESNSMNVNYSGHNNAASGMKREESDLLKLKRALMENLVRRLFQLTRKYKVKDKEISLIENEDTTINDIFLDEKALDDRLAVKAGIASLYRRAVAKELTSTMKTEVLEATEKIRERQLIVKLRANERLLLIILSLISGSLGVLLGLNPILEKPLNAFLSILIAILPTFAISLTTEFRNKSSKRNNDAQIASTFYRYDYDLSNLEAELEFTLRRLQELKCKVIFVIDELDKLSNTEIVNGVIKLLKTLFTQGNAIFILVTGKELFFKIMKDPSERLTEYTLFTQTIFLQRAKFEEIRMFIERIMKIYPSNTNNQNAVRILFNFDDVKEDKMIKDYVKDGYDIDDNLKNIETAIVTKKGDDIVITYNRGAVGTNENKPYPITISKFKNTPNTLIIPDETGKAIVCEFGVLKLKDNSKHKETYFLYSKSKDFLNFQYYACYLSKTDFFDLYKVLRDNIEYNNLKLKVKIDDTIITYANLQRAIEAIFIRKKLKNPSSWLQNDLILDNMYTFLNALTESHMNLRYIQFNNDPFEIRYLSSLKDKDNPETKKFEQREIGYSKDIVQNALNDLIKYLRRLRFLTPTHETNIFEVTGSLPYVDISIQELVQEEKDFVEQYSLLCYVIWSYIKINDKYGR
jgi:hypothetical protein